MSRGPGRVQMACLSCIQKAEADEEWPTTYHIAAAVYQVKPDKDGVCWLTDAQHVAVKRALEGLQRQGRIIGFRTRRPRIPGLGPGSDGRTELCHHWMTATRAAKWVAERRKIAATAHRPKSFSEEADRIVKKAKAVGMKLP